MPRALDESCSMDGGGRGADYIVIRRGGTDGQDQPDIEIQQRLILRDSIHAVLMTVKTNSINDWVFCD